MKQSVEDEKPGGAARVGAGLSTRGHNIAGRGPRETSYREAMTQDIVGGSEVQQAAKRRSERSPAPTCGCRPLMSISSENK